MKLKKRLKGVEDIGKARDERVEEERMRLWHQYLANSTTMNNDSIYAGMSPTAPLRGQFF